jgi:hypothetical protein
MKSGLMSRNVTISAQDIEELDRFYRTRGWRNLASPLVHYQESTCPHAGCTQKLEWIDFQLELFGDPEGIYKPLVTAWWDGTGFAGRCPACGGRVHFTTLRMRAPTDDEVQRLPRFPDQWQSVAQFA